VEAEVDTAAVAVDTAAIAVAVVVQSDSDLVVDWDTVVVAMVDCCNS